VTNIGFHFIRFILTYSKRKRRQQNTDEIFTMTESTNTLFPFFKYFEGWRCFDLVVLPLLEGLAGLLPGGGNLKLTALELNLSLKRQFEKLERGNEATK